MNEFRSNQLDELKDKDYRESYAEDYLHSFIAMQFRVVREQREMTQEELAQEIRTKQTAISRLENINNRSRNLTLLQKAAFALGCRLRVSLETFGSLISDEGPKFSREMLLRPSFDDEFGSVSLREPKDNVISLITVLQQRDNSSNQDGAPSRSAAWEGQGKVSQSGSEEEFEGGGGSALLHTEMAQKKAG